MGNWPSRRVPLAEPPKAKNATLVTFFACTQIKKLTLCADLWQVLVRYRFNFWPYLKRQLQKQQQYSSEVRRMLYATWRCIDITPWHLQYTTAHDWYAKQHRSVSPLEIRRCTDMKTGLTFTVMLRQSQPNHRQLIAFKFRHKTIYLSWNICYERLVEITHVPSDHKIIFFPYHEAGMISLKYDVATEQVRVLSQCFPQQPEINCVIYNVDFTSNHLYGPPSTVIFGVGDEAWLHL